MPHHFVFHIRPPISADPSVSFSLQESHHLNRVLRLDSGDMLEAVDGEGMRYAIRLTDRLGGCWRGTVVDRWLDENDLLLPIILALPCLKGDRWEIALDAACQLGVSEVWLVDFALAERPWNKGRTERAKRKAIEALKQSGGSRLTKIQEPCSLGDFLSQSLPRKLWLAAPSATPLPALTGSVSLIIGPEAGTKQDEENYLEHCGAHRFSLGSRRLRSEMAICVALAQTAIMLSPK